jgi:anti-sigma B factor antagonist
MEIRKRTVDAVAVISLSGDLDSRSAPAVQDKMTALLPANSRVLLDFTGVPYVSSAGLRTMLLVYRQAQCVDSTVALVGLSAELKSVLAATGFLDFFVVADNVQAGISALGQREGAA